MIALKSILLDEEWTAKAVWWVRAVTVGVLVPFYTSNRS